MDKYEYAFTSLEDVKENNSTAWWTRKKVSEMIKPIQLKMDYVQDRAREMKVKRRNNLLFVNDIGQSLLDALRGAVEDTPIAMPIVLFLAPLFARILLGL